MHVCLMHKVGSSTTSKAAKNTQRPHVYMNHSQKTIA